MNKAFLGCHQKLCVNMFNIAFEAEVCYCWAKIASYDPALHMHACPGPCHVHFEVHWHRSIEA